MRRLLIALLLVLFLPVAILAAGLFWLRSSLPVSEGRLTLPGLAAEVRVSRDDHGIPTIDARNEHDAVFALGFLHAQDRLFQMDLMRRYGAGRLAEWFGPPALGADRFTRTLGIYRLAERQYDLASPELRGALDAYAAGVNAFLAERKGALPPEYYLIGAAPEPWRPADSLVWGKLMDLQLSGNFRQELLHARLAERLTPEDLAVLYPPYPKDAPVALGDARKWLDGLPLEAIYASLPDFVGPRFASNNWVVDGKHTVSGKPLLANDPHLGFSAPGVWYLMRIDTPQLKLAGVTSPGGPFVVIGHNAHIAWGFTSTASDVEDLFIERVDPDEPTRYLTPDGAQPFSVRQEEIRVHGAAPVRFTVRATRHGPVISDLGGNYAKAAAAGTVLALDATWLAEDDRTPEAVWALDHSRNWDEFRHGLEAFVAPQQNIVFADTEGNIGFIAPARVPIRGKGEGWVPAPGWNGDYDWTGYIPFDRLPQTLNPPSGRVVTANNKIVPDSYPYFLGRGWDLPNRAERINELLDATPQESVADFAAIQGDTLSLMARNLLPLMLQATPSSPEEQAALARLKAWDGHMERGEVAPLLFVAWLRELNRTLLADKLGDAFADYWGLHPDVIRLILTQQPEWCQRESCAPQLTQALGRAVAELARRYGDDMDAWRWGRAHEAQFASELWSRVPVLGRLLALRVPADGGYDTVNRGATPIASAAAPYADTFGATLRMIVDLSDIDASRFMIAPGQSGNPLSPHYRDLMRPWRDLGYVTLERGAGGATLVLGPP